MIRRGSPAGCQIVVRNPEGCPRVAGGRRPPDRHAQTFRTPEGCKRVAPLRGAIIILTVTGGLRFASTSGYSLATLRVAGPPTLSDCNPQDCQASTLRICNPEGCPRVAGGRRPPDRHAQMFRTPEGCQGSTGKGCETSGTPPGCDHYFNRDRRSALRFDLRLLSCNPPGCYLRLLSRNPPGCQQNKSGGARKPSPLYRSLSKYETPLR